MGGSIIKCVGWNAISFGYGRVHGVAVGVTRIAIRAVGRAHGAAALVFQMTCGTRQIFRHVRLMKIVLRVATQTRLINLRHRFVVRRKKFDEFMRGGMRGERSLRPIRGIFFRSGMTVGAGCDRVVRGNFSR